MAKSLRFRLLSDTSGTSTIELAIIVPVVAMLTFVAADLAMAFRAKLGLQVAAERTAQMATAGGLNSAAYQNLAADAAQAAKVSTSNVSVTHSLLCDGTVQTSTSEICATGQQVKRYVRVSISGIYRPIFMAMLPGSRWSRDGGVALTGSASVRLQ